MNSMYDTLLGLPLLKGISRTQLSDFIERTPLHFTTYQSGEVVVEDDEPCNTVKTLISGSIRVQHSLMQGRVLVGYTLKAPAMISMHHLFGLHTSSVARSTAIGTAGVMEFEKKHYLDLLRVNRICLMNVMNHLSWRAQRTGTFFKSISKIDAKNRLAILVLSVTDAASTDILLTCNKITIDKALCTSVADRKMLQEMEDQGIIHIKSESCIEIPSYMSLREYIYM